LPLYLWSCAVGLSRVVLGVHFPTDILAGALLGTGIAWAVDAFYLAQFATAR
jgi:undecaprenyl-diphosphatase